MFLANSPSVHLRLSDFLVSDSEDAAPQGGLQEEEENEGISSGPNAFFEGKFPERIATPGGVWTRRNWCHHLGFHIRSEF